MDGQYRQDNGRYYKRNYNSNRPNKDNQDKSYTHSGHLSAENEDSSLNNDFSKGKISNISSNSQKNRKDVREPNVKFTDNASKNNTSLPTRNDGNENYFSGNNLRPPKGNSNSPADEQYVMSQNYSIVQKYLRFFKLKPQIIISYRIDDQFKASLHLPTINGPPLIFTVSARNKNKAKNAVMSDAVSYINDNALMDTLNYRNVEQNLIYEKVQEINSLISELTKLKSCEQPLPKKINHNSLTPHNRDNNKRFDALYDRNSKNPKRNVPQKPFDNFNNPADYLQNHSNSAPDISNINKQTSSAPLQTWNVSHDLPPDSLSTTAPLSSSINNKLMFRSQNLLSAQNYSLGAKNAGWNNCAQTSNPLVTSSNSDKSSYSWFSSKQQSMGNAIGNLDDYNNLQSASNKIMYESDKHTSENCSSRIDCVPPTHRSGSNINIFDKTKWPVISDSKNSSLGSQSRIVDMSSSNSHVNDITLPSDFDHKKFIEFYFHIFGLSVPKAILTENKARDSSSSRNQSWSVTYEIPKHKISGREVEFKIQVTELNKKIAIENAKKKLVRRLVNECGKVYLDKFTESTMTYKKKVEKVLEEPSKIVIPPSTSIRLSSLFKILELKNAFSITPSKIDDDDFDYPIKSSKQLHFVHPHVQNPIKLTLESIPDIYENSTKLPIHKMYKRIIHAIETNPVTIISAQTGAGKTTQVPQFILDYFSSKHKQSKYSTYNKDFRPPSVICTQPRRIAAISIAELVEKERAVKDDDSSVGYAVRFASKPPNYNSPSGSILFCTSGILMSRFQIDPMLKSYTHIILDEVHERDLNTDLLLVLTRHLLSKRSDLRLILMSATADTSIFMEYFRGYGNADPNKMPALIDVPGRMYSVKEHYLEDVLDIIHKSPVLKNFQPSQDQHDFVCSEISGTNFRLKEDPVPYAYLEALITHICTTCSEGTILVFLPGWQEIRTLHGILMEDNYKIGYADSKLYELHSLHSSIPVESQTLVFRKAPRGCRKIIISTGIAETSITIDDVVYVVDLGKVRVNSYSSDCRISTLKSQWASRSNIRQRMGRAGRTMPGIYYSFISLSRKKTLPYNIPPEMLRVDLQQVALLIKSLKLARNVKDVFSLAPNPPSPSSIDTVLKQLTVLGALGEDEKITPFGSFTCRLVIDPWIAKMVVLGTLFLCMDSVVTIASLMETSKSLYHLNFDNKDIAWRHIVSKYVKNSASDQITSLNAFRSWLKYDTPDNKSNPYNNGYRTLTSRNESYNYAVENYLNFTTCFNVKKHCSHLFKLLSGTGLLKTETPANSNQKRSNEIRPFGMGNTSFDSYNVNNDNFVLVRAILAGALYPNISEIKSKGEYRTFTDRFHMRLSTTCVNSWKSIVMQKEAEYMERHNIKLPPPPQHNKSNPHMASRSSISLDSINSHKKQKEQYSLYNASQIYYDDPPLPIRLVAFEQKQQVDNSFYLRQVTKATPMSLVLFANFGNIKYEENNDTNNGIVIIDDTIPIQIGDLSCCHTIIELRKWLDRYLEWIIWNRCSKSLEQYGDKEENIPYFRPNDSFDYEGSDDELGEEFAEHYRGISNPQDMDVETDNLGKALIKEVINLICANEEAE